MEGEKTQKLQALGVSEAVVDSNAYSESPKEFRFTRNNPVLTTEQRQFYEDNGFLVIPKLVPLDLLEKYKTRFQEIADGRVIVNGLSILKDYTVRREKFCEENVNKIQDYFYDDVLFEYVRLPQILDHVECFTGPNIKGMHTMLINKPPDHGKLTSRHPLHQDLHYFNFRPADRIVCAWTAIEPITRANGCLVAIPGTHKGPLHEHKYPDWEGGVNRLFEGITDLSKVDTKNLEYLECEPGDTVFFHPLLIHGSGSNKTTGFRKSISCHYAPSDGYYVEVKGTGQEPIANELVEISGKRGYVMHHVKDLWKIRGHLVRGVESTL